jgi:DNA polymerase III delta prime subunit
MDNPIYVESFNIEDFSSKSKVELLNEIGDSVDTWHSPNGKDFFFNYKSIKSIESGLYSIVYTQDNGFGVSKMTYKPEDYLVLPSLPHEDIISDIKKFWASKEQYTKYNITHKRGIILHGEPGGGKTSLIYLLIEEMKQHNGICIYFDSPKTWIAVANLIRKIEGDRPILCIIEDIDGIIEDFGEEIFLNFLDGLNQISNIVYVATTNNLKDIPDRIKDRPSRFDKKYEVKKPTKEDRKVYFEHMIHEEDKNLYDIENIIKDTDKFSMAHLKEVFISLYILRNDYKKTMSELKNSKINESGIGFNIKG